jgi:hypothetical protein
MLPICHNSQNISIEKKSELLIRPKKFRGMPWVPWYFARMLGLKVPNRLRIAKCGFSLVGSFATLVGAAEAETDLVRRQLGTYDPKNGNG